jgi:tRNA1(Val) A37 N6-methylase TrmN6
MLIGAPWVKLGCLPERKGRGVVIEGRSLPEDVSETLLWDSRVRLLQAKAGYRANADTVLLAASLEAGSGARLMEAGCGAGGALFIAAARFPDANFIGVERESACAALARENAVLNDVSGRVEIVEGDALARDLKLGTFDAVFFNPPFDQAGEGRAPAEARRAAHIAEVPTERWIAALADRLSGGGVLTLIQRALKLPEILTALEGRLGGAEILPIFPRLGEPAKRVLVRARKGSRAPFALRRGLVLHDDIGAKHTPEAEAILRGAAPLLWE